MTHEEFVTKLALLDAALSKRSNNRVVSTRLNTPTSVVGWNLLYLNNRQYHYMHVNIYGHTAIIGAVIEANSYIGQSKTYGHGRYYIWG